MIRNGATRGGGIEVICGPMFSGKSEELIRRLRRAEIANQRVLIVKPGIDDRFDISHVVSHSGIQMRAVGVGGPDDIPRFAEGYEVIGIDEIQFFHSRIVDVCVELAERGVRVVAAGLDMDFRAEPFGPVPELLARAELVDKLHAVCHRCGGAASRTQRLVDGEPAPFSGETIQVGARDAYEARCRECYQPGTEVALERGTPVQARGPSR